MSGTRRVCALGLVTAVLVGSSAMAQRAGTSLHVIVADATNEAYLLDAQVTLKPLGLKRTTDFFGDARFPPLPSGVYTVEARRIGYAPISTLAKFSGRDSLQLILLMKPASQELPDVTIKESATSPFLREFEDRRRQGTGYYICLL